MQTQALFDNISEHIIQALDKANHSIYIAVVWFTRTDIFEVLLNKVKAGVAVHLALVEDYINQTADICYDDLTQFTNAHLYWTGDNTLTHNKFCVVDNQILIIGSFNWREDANTHHHEYIMMNDNVALCKIYYEKFFEIIQQPAPNIDKLIEQKYGISVYQDVDILTLKLEISLLENDIHVYDNERTEVEKLLADFHYQYSMQLGDIISEILSLKKQIALQNNDQTAYEEAEQDEKIYQEQLFEQKSKVYHELSDKDKKKLKQVYRKASQLCHPDRVSDEQKEVAQAIFVELTQAYEQNDLKKVEQILLDLQKGIFKARSDTVTQLDTLKMIKTQLSQKLADIQQILDSMKRSETYQVISKLYDWDNYFEEQKMRLAKERDRLQSLITFTQIDE